MRVACLQRKLHFLPPSPFPIPIELRCRLTCTPLERMQHELLHTLKRACQYAVEAFFGRTIDANRVGEQRVLFAFLIGAFLIEILPCHERSYVQRAFVANTDYRINKIYNGTTTPDSARGISPATLQACAAMQTGRIYLHLRLDKLQDNDCVHKTLGQ